MTLTTLVIIAVVTVVVAILVFKLLSGAFTYKDEVISTETKHVIRMYDSSRIQEYDVSIITIKRTYDNGKIKFLTQKL